MNRDVKIRLKRLRIYGIVGILYSAFLIYDYLYIDKNISEIILAISLFISSIIFLCAPLIIKKLGKNKSKSK